LSHLENNLVRCLLLLGLVEDVYAPARLVCSVWYIVPSATLVLIGELLNSSNVLLIELDLLEVLSNPGGGDRLGNDGVSADLAPGKDDLSGCSSLFLSNSLDLRASDEEGNVEEVVAESRVGGDVDVLLLGVGNELLARKNGVALDLVDSGNEVCLLNQSLEVLVREVGDTNRANLALGKLVDGLPCFAVRHRVVDVDLVGVGGGREKIRVRVLSRSEVDRPVNEVEVEVLKLEFGKCVVKSSLDVLRVVLGVP